jgi:hypothetical protein
MTLVSRSDDGIAVLGASGALRFSRRLSAVTVAGITLPTCPAAAVVLRWLLVLELSFRNTGVGIITLLID